MLYEIYAENFALISTLRMSLGEGMNALTGETGAGKSLLIDAVSLLIGGRGSDNFIRSGCDKCLLEGIFLPPYPQPAVAFLQEHDIDAEDNLILSRELVRGGRSIARINGRPANLSLLRELGRMLINIHGQQEHMLLLDEEQQLLLLDSFSADIAAPLTATAQAYQQMQQAKRQVAEFENGREQRARRMDELHYLIDELEQAELHPGEDEQLSAEAHLLAHGEKLFQLAGDAISALNGSGAAVDSLNAAMAAVKNVAALDPQAEELSSRLQSVFFEAEDLARELAAYRDRVDLDAYRLEAVDARLSMLNKLKKKYQASLEGLMQLLAQSKSELAELESFSLSGAALYQAQQQAESVYDQAARQLSAARSQAARLLGEAVTRELHALAMPAATFRVELPAAAPSLHGNERALFMIQPNTGEPLLPVAKIASGGELSRIVLGLKVILAQLDTVPTLIFDEVDTGLSGKALVSVAQRIALVGENAQALVVTHNAVMAAAATHQIMIEKHEEAGRTVVAAHSLSEAERIDEIARMIAGDKAGATTRSQAKEMLEMMRQPTLF